jgi:hypothetical protein
MAYFHCGIKSASITTGNFSLRNAVPTGSSCIMQLVALPWSKNAVIARTFPTIAFRQHFRNQAKGSDQYVLPILHT